MKDIYNKIQEVIASRLPAALCMVVETKGSTPRKAGAKMIVHEDGSIFGTIGGGNIEVTVIKEALNVIKDNRPKLISYDLDKDLEMNCNGKASVYIEPIISNCPLYLFGAGHVNKALSKYAKDFGFQVTLFDERPGIELCPEYENTNVIVKPFAQSIEEANYDSGTFIVIATPGHASDEFILKAVAKKPCAYLGMIGSKSKVATLKHNLISNNIMTESELSRIHMPIGIPFASVTPEEIAISILAQLIDCKNSMF